MQIKFRNFAQPMQDCEKMNPTKPFPHCGLPPYLKPGDAVALISPSYRAPDGQVADAAEVLRGWGLRPVMGPNADKCFAGKYAGTPDERLSDLRRALGDPEIKAMLCNRGGYGALHLLERIGADELAACPKWLIGCSDITLLLQMENCAGVAAVHGPMCSGIAPSGGTAPDCEALRDLLFGRVPRYELPPHPLNRPGRACGILTGGNLCTFTPGLDLWADTTRFGDLVLFIEEVEETMHHIDRLFNMLRLRGVPERCRAVVLGDFTRCTPDLGYGSVEEMLLTYLAPYGIPVLCGFPAGHGPRNFPLLTGVPVTVDVRPDGASLCFGVPGEAVTIAP